MATRITLIPAYGRDYTSKAKVAADWHADKDFLSVGFGSGGYTNRTDLANLGMTATVRYKGQTMAVNSEELEKLKPKVS
jgi:hypothetical protein